jgi:glutathione S-transferase
MSRLLLFVGNKSSCDDVLAPWMALSMFGIPFRETADERDGFMRDALLPEEDPCHELPMLQHGRQAVWGALGIMEYLAELFPEKNLWPKTISARVIARAVSYEAQSRLRIPQGGTSDGHSGRHLRGNGKARVEQIVRQCRSKFGKGGKFLFGRFTIPDAMLAPYVLFLETRAIEVESETRSYMDALLSTEAMMTWREAFSEKPSATMLPKHAPSYISELL